jgi:hypothetical protein
MLYHFFSFFASYVEKAASGALQSIIERASSILKGSLLIRKSINKKLIPGKKQFSLFVEMLLNSMEGSGEHALEWKLSNRNISLTHSLMELSPS